MVVRNLLFVLVFLLIPLFSYLNSQVFYIDLSGDWKFVPDPDDKGLREGWFKRLPNRGSYCVVSVPDFWESNEELRNYDGVAWYFKDFVVSRGSSDGALFIGFGGVDDEFDIWIDSYYIGHFGDRDRGVSYYNRKAVIKLPFGLTSGKHKLVVRVKDWLGGGGIHKSPVCVTSDTTILYTREERVKKLYKMFPEALWPYWVSGKGRAWTVVGLPNGDREGLVSIDGSVQWNKWKWSSSVWIKSDDGEILTPESCNQEEIEWGLVEDYLPIPVLKFSEKDFKIKKEYFVVDGKLSDEILVERITIENCGDRSRNLQLFLAVRPYTVTGSVGRIDTIFCNESGEIIINNNSKIFCSLGVPEMASFIPVSVLPFGESKGDISLYSILSETVEENYIFDDKLGMNSGVFVWDFKVKDAIDIVIYYSHEFEVDFDFNVVKKRSKVIDEWQHILRKTIIKVPDEDIKNAYYASLAYILINADGYLPHPGPWVYDNAYFRDSAYILTTLLYNGHIDFARETVKTFMKAQGESGEFFPIFDRSYREIGVNEWDSQGQGIYMFGKYFCFSLDTQLVRTYWDNIMKAVIFVDSLIQEDEYGILPPSWSAEDLGSPEWHHFWDDFWCMIGLRNALNLAKAGGFYDDAERIGIIYKKLDENLWALIKDLIEEKGIKWIPNGPEDLHGSSMARGTSPLIYPGLMSYYDLDIVKVSFDYYWEKWVSSYNGAYLHQGKFWLYAFELADCYARLGQSDRFLKIIQWHIDNQTFPGVYAWGEQLNEETFNLEAGDMPHAWVAADFVASIRDALFFERGDTLVIGAGIPWEWYRKGKEIGIENGYSIFGRVNFDTKLKGNKIKWKLNIGDKSLKGIILKVPDCVTIKRAKVNGSNWTDFKGNFVRLPISSKNVVITIDEKGGIE